MDLQLIEDGLNVLVRLCVTRHHQPAAIHHRDPDLDHLNGGELVEHSRRRQTRRVDHQAVLQCDLQRVSQKRDQHMCIAAEGRYLRHPPPADKAGYLSAVLSNSRLT